MRCCVNFCRNATEKVSKSDGITFHHFPTDQSLRAAWVKALGKQEGNLPDTAVVCSQHFLDDDIYKTVDGIMKIRGNVVPSAVQICMICLNTNSKLVSMSKYKMEKAYEHLTGHPVYDKGNIKQTLCVECAQRLVNFSRFRDKSLRASAIMMDLVKKYEFITLRHINLINREEKRLQTNISKKFFKPDHTDLNISYSDVNIKREFNETAHKVDETLAVEYDHNHQSTSANDHFITVKLEMPNYDDDDDGDQAVSNDNYSLNDSATTDHVVNKVANVKARDMFKYEGVMFSCTECSEEFVDEEAYNKHVVEHSKMNGEDYKYKPVSELTHLDDSSKVAHSSVTLKNHKIPEQSDVSSKRLKRTSATSSSLKDIKKTKLPQTNAFEDHKQIFLVDNCINTTSNYLDDECKGDTENGGSLKKIDSSDDYAEGKRFMCDICQESFKRRSQLVKHIKSSLQIKLFTCKLCQYKTAYRCGFVCHTRTHIGEKPFECKHCDYKCARNGELAVHMRTHTGERPYQCKLCDYKFARRMYLMRHMKTHTGEKPFLCNMCEYRCAKKSGLVTHMRTHTGEKPFICKVCLYRFSQKMHLVSHMRTHTGDKPFTCNICDFKCTTNWSLGRHMRVHTGEKPFSCDLCNYRSANNWSLVRHMKGHTGEQSLP